MAYPTTGTISGSLLLTGASGFLGQEVARQATGASRLSGAPLPLRRSGSGRVPPACVRRASDQDAALSSVRSSSEPSPA
ncbi:MAG: hypothetical protein ACK2U9_22555, partial [Anaerolineae bacterium]